MQELLFLKRRMKNIFVDFIRKQTVRYEQGAALPNTFSLFTVTYYFPMIGKQRTSEEQKRNDRQASFDTCRSLTHPKGSRTLLFTEEAPCAATDHPAAKSCTFAAGKSGVLSAYPSDEQSKNGTAFAVPFLLV